MKTNWKKVKLGEICDISSGGTPSRKNPEYFEGEIPWAKIDDLNTDNGVVSSTQEKITEDGLKNIRNKIFEKGTLFLAMYGSVGKTAFAGTEMSCNQAILGINPKGDAIDMRYLNYWIIQETPELLNRAVGVTQKNLSATIVRDIEISLPPLPIQKKIADALDKADEIRRKRQESINKLDELVQSIFLDMFGDPVKNEKKLARNSLSCFISNTTNGISRRRKTLENIGDIVLRLRDVGKNYIDYSDLNRIPLDSTEKEKAKLLDQDIVFIRVNGNPDYVGRSAVFTRIKESVYFNDHIIRIRLTDDLNPFYVTSFLNSHWGTREIRKHIKTSAGQHTINQTGLGKIEILIPNIELQNEYSARVAYLDERKDLLSEQYIKSDYLFNSLMQKAFSGELEFNT